ncbi:MAG: TonB-dependent receptor [Muribaculaceae bacterium]|nr:TonB-dependent receptor [Muribaculaceae bacterium]
MIKTIKTLTIPKSVSIIHPCREVLLTFVAFLLMLPSFHTFGKVESNPSALPLTADTLPELTVSSNASIQTVRSTSARHNLLSSELQKKGIDGISDAMRRLPGISLKDYGGAGGMKTVAVQGMGAQHTGVAIDGVMISDARSGQIDLSRFSLDNVGSISLTIGNDDNIFTPARFAAAPSVLAINSFSSRNQDILPHLRAQFRFGSFQLISSALRYEQNLSSKFSIGGNADFIHAKNDYPFTLKNLTVVTKERRHNSRMNSGHGEIHTSWKFSPSANLDAKIYYYDNNRQLPGQVRYYTTLSSESLHDRNFFSQITLKTPLSSIFSIRGCARFNWDATAYKDPSYTNNLRDALYYQREAYISSTLLANILPELSLSYALDYTFRNLSSSTMSIADHHPERNSVLQALSARWTPGRFSVTARLLGSIYLNHTRSGMIAKDEKRLSPAISASFKILPYDDFYIRAGFKDIFRVPSFSELYFYHLGNSELRPETTRQFNLGLSFAKEIYSGRGVWETTLTADSYLNFVNDMILAVPYNMFIWTNINVGKVKTAGLDINLSVNYHPSESQLILLSGNASIQDATDRTPDATSFGKQIAYIPRLSGGASIAWENPWINMAVSCTGASRRWSNNDHKEATDINPYIEMNATIYRTIKLSSKHKFEIRFDLKNFLNTQYELVRMYPMPGINYSFSLSYLLN